MIVLDAGILIAAWDATDAHHQAARSVILDHPALIMHPMNLAEALVHVIRRGKQDWARTHLRALALESAALTDEHPFILARIRAATGLKMPDCCPIAVAEEQGIDLATLDKSVARAASDRGITVMPYEPKPSAAQRFPPL